jgi:predicted PurR-regulated permease PerM
LEAPPDSTAPQAFRTRIFVTARQQIASHSRELLSFVSDAVFRAVSHAENVLYVVLVPILSFFFLKDGRKILRSVLGSLGEGSRRDTMKSIADDLHLLLAEYMRALVMLAAAVFIVYASFFSLIGVPYGVLLGAIAFPFEFIPLVGPLTAGAIILIVAGVSGYTHLLWIVIFLGAYRLFQDYVLSPYLLGSGTELHPLLVIFGVLAGGQIAGIAGTFLSVPVLATLWIVYRQLSKRHNS